MSLPTVHTFYKSNIDPDILFWQDRVFQHFGIPLKQWKNDDISHGQWLTEIFRSKELGPLTVVCDIDAFPLSAIAFEKLVGRAEAGALSGLAQVANARDPNRIYAGPMFLAIQRTIYEDLGAPDLVPSKHSDPAQALTDICRAAGVEVALTMPKFAILPKWPLEGLGVFGIGTFYGDNEFFHLFEARKKKSKELFIAVAKATIAGRQDFQEYLDIMELSPAKKDQKKPSKGMAGFFRTFRRR